MTADREAAELRRQRETAANGCPPRRRQRETAAHGGPKG